MATPPQLQQQYDLTATMAPFLDRHLLFPLLEFASARGLYDDASIQDAKVALLAQTNMVDYAADVWRAARGTEPPAEFAAKREEVVAKLKSLQVSRVIVWSDFRVIDGGCESRFDRSNVKNVLFGASRWSFRCVSLCFLS